jgi:hypothetical protein
VLALRLTVAAGHWGRVVGVGGVEPEPSAVASEAAFIREWAVMGRMGKNGSRGLGHSIFVHSHRDA